MDWDRLQDGYDRLRRGRSSPPEAICPFCGAGIYPDEEACFSPRGWVHEDCLCDRLNEVWRAMRPEEKLLLLEGGTDLGEAGERWI